MAIEYQLDMSRGLTLVVWDGDVTFDESTNYLIRLAADSDYPPGPLHLTDLTTAADVAPPETDLLTELVAGSDPFRMAIVAPDTSAAARHFEEAAEAVGTTVAVFDDLQAAGAWLGIDHEAAGATLDAIRRDL